MNRKQAAPLFIFLISRILLLSAVYAAFACSMHNLGAPLSLDAWLRHWARADSGWYFSIVENGYSYVPSGRSNIVFFPLYPMLVFFFNLFFHNLALTAVIISNACFLLALVFLYKLVQQQFGERAAWDSTLLLALFPFSFFYSTAYAESLFLLLAVLSFYYAERDNWGKAALSAMFCSASRAVGLFLLPALILRYLEKIEFDRRRIRANFYCLLIIPLGFLFYMGYLWMRFGTNPLFMLRSTELAWERGLFNFSRLNYAFSNFLADDKAILYLFYVILTLFFIFSLRNVLRYLKAGYALFAFCLIITPVLTSLQSMGRFLSVIFPCFIAIACACRFRLLLYVFYVFCAVMLCAFGIYFMLAGRLY
ncbi:MAG: glycosyltransferase family 39 protein [Candidatus Omnitrophica bacterium]|jgi:hypothetical protein|nr:glycosyltransferase family 39 protein [Candidatus Omnitrophota bacterium]